MCSYVFYTVLLVTVIQINGENFKCDMVPVRTDDGLVGYCCMFFKNSSAMPAQTDEIIKTLANSKESDTVKETPNVKVSTDMPETTAKGNKTIPVPKDTSVITFKETETPDNHIRKNSETQTWRNRTNIPENMQRMNRTRFRNRNRPTTKPTTISMEEKIFYPIEMHQKSAGKNLTNVKEDKAEEDSKVKDEKAHFNKTVDIIIDGRNKDDVPVTCTDGQGEDINGDCVPSF